MRSSKKTFFTDPDPPPMQPKFNINVSVLKKKRIHNPSFAIQKSKRADSQAQWIDEKSFNSKVLRP